MRSRTPSLNARVAGGLCALACAAAAAPAALAADGPAKVVVVPVTLIGGREPDPSLVAAVAEGLRSNVRWAVEYGTKGRPLTVPAIGMPEADRTRIANDVAAAADKIGAEPAAALTQIEAAWNELRAARELGPIGPAGDDLAWRAGRLLVAARLAAGADADATKAAGEVRLLFPGRQPEETGGVTAAAVERLKTVSLPHGEVATVTFRSRPEGCSVMVNGQPIGVAPVDLVVLPGAKYHAVAECRKDNQTIRSFDKTVTAPLAGESRQEVLDALYEQALVNDASGTRLRFSSGDERRQLEESYARRTAEKFGADDVVFVSVGELSGTDWLDARLYLRSGYQNRMGLVRLELPRAAALGTYLASGKELPGVLRREEALALASASRQASQPGTGATLRPWYTDVPGWILVGLGAGGMGFGWYARGEAEDKKNAATAADLNNDPFAAEQLRKESSQMKFLSNAGLVGGGLVLLTGVALLVTPEYGSRRSELVGFAPLPGGGTVTLAGRF